MVKGSSSGLMAVGTRANSRTTTSMVEVSTLGQMDANIMVIGSMGRCMGKEYIHGKMVNLMKEIFNKIRNKALEF